MFSVEPRGDRVTILRMDDGKVNAIGPTFLEQFPHVWADVTSRGTAVVLAGNGRALSAGLDLKTLPTLDLAQTTAFARSFVRAFADIYAHPRPVVAAVDGAAMAGGAYLALCADFRIVTERARIGLTETPVGVPFPAPLIDLATAALPPPEHAPAILQGIVRTGEDAVARGWAHASAPHENVLDAAVALADELAAFPADAYASAKRVMRARVLADVRAFEADAGQWAARLRDPGTMAAIGRSFAQRTQR